MKCTSLFLLLTLALTVTPFVLPQPASAQSCSGATTVTSDIWAHFAEVTTDLGCTLLREYADEGGAPYRVARSARPNCWAADVHSAILQEMITYWNYRVDNSWATIGPRRIDLDEHETGRLVSTGGRTFLSPSPLAQRRVTITIDELDGRARTGIAICKIDEHNERTLVRTVWFNDTRAQKRNRSERRVVQVRGARDRLLMVHMDAKSVTNTFRYRLRAE
jgi:hypothetical protein